MNGTFLQKKLRKKLLRKKLPPSLKTKLIFMWRLFSNSLVINFKSLDFFLLSALYGVLFESDEEAAFSNYRLWESLGFIFAYILQINVCIYTKLWVILCVLGTGMLGYLIIEFQERRRNRSAEVTPVTSK